MAALQQLGEECANIEGATDQTYTPVAADLSKHAARRGHRDATAKDRASATSAASPQVAEGAGSGIRYLYDEAGRLDLVDDPTQGAAVYHWDADGNLLSIQRYSASTLAVLQTTPAHAPPGTQVDITGTGFSTEASNDEVSFDGIAATVSKATATDLFVTVPEGASTGAITVKIGEHSAESPGAFKPFVRTVAPVTRRQPAVAQRRATGAHQRIVSRYPRRGRAAGASQAVPASVSAYRSPYTASWRPEAKNRRDGDWITARHASPWAKLPQLRAPRGATALSGQALEIDGMPLANVTSRSRAPASTQRPTAAAGSCSPGSPRDTRSWSSKAKPPTDTASATAGSRSASTS